MTAREVVWHALYVLVLVLGNTFLCGLFLCVASVDLDKWLCGLAVTALEVFWAFAQAVMEECGEVDCDGTPKFCRGCGAKTERRVCDAGQ